MSEQASNSASTGATSPQTPETNQPTPGVPAHASSTDAPSTDAPSTDAPSTDASSTDASSTDALSADALSTDASSTDAPSHEEAAPQHADWGADGDSISPLQQISRRTWLLIGAVIISGAFAAGLWWAPEEETHRPESNGEPQVVFLGSTPTVIPTLEVLLPTPTPTPELDTPALDTPVQDTSQVTSSLGPPGVESSLAQTETQTNTVTDASVPAFEFVLPTVTPTPEPPPVTPRAVQVGGQVNLRMQMANPAFQSGGRPLQIPISPRTYVLDGETTSIDDHWCVQMGLVNLDLNLSLSLNPATSSVIATGTAELYNDFCDNRGAVADSTGINLTIPADARSQSAYNLFGERQLLNLAGLLDMETGVIVELNITNSRPAREETGD